MSKSGKNTDPSPMVETYTSIPNRRNQRAYLAMTADTLSKDDLASQAADLGFDLSGATTKEEMVAAVRNAVQ